jgi:hypothetical protein
MIVESGMGPLVNLGTAWAYVLPFLYIVGGLLFGIGRFRRFSTWLVGIALGSLPIGAFLKSVISDIPLEQTMPAAVNAFAWIAIFLLITVLSASIPAAAVGSSKRT